MIYRNAVRKQLQIDLVVREAAKESIVEKAYDRKYGARPLRRKTAG